MRYSMYTYSMYTSILNNINNLNNINGYMIDYRFVNFWMADGMIAVHGRLWITKYD